MVRKVARRKRLPLAEREAGPIRTSLALARLRLDGDVDAAALRAYVAMAAAAARGLTGSRASCAGRQKAMREEGGGGRGGLPALDSETLEAMDIPGFSKKVAGGGTAGGGGRVRGSSAKV